MDVTVNKQLKFFETVVVPLIQFIVRVLDISALVQRQVRTVPNCAGDREDFTGAVLVRSWSRPSLRTDMCRGCSRQYRKP